MSLHWNKHSMKETCNKMRIGYWNDKKCSILIEQNSIKIINCYMAAFM